MSTEEIVSSDPKVEITTYLERLRNCARKNMKTFDGVKGWHYAGMGDFLLQNGVWFPAPKGLAKWQGPLKQCFENSAKAVKRFKGWKYCEGIAFGIIPVHHAWCVSPDGAVQEVTWRDPGSAYLGVTFDKPEPCIFDRWVEQDYEIYKKPFKVTA